ncbi:MAG: ribosome maturation factor RimM [Chitinophagales bacterium]
MDINNLYQVGVIIKSKGLKGEIKISFEAFFLAYLEETESELEHLFVRTKTDCVPYFLEKITAQGNYHIIKFEDVDTKNNAEKLRNAKLLIETEKVADFLEEEENTFWNFLLGFTLMNDDVEIGKIEDVYYLDTHELAMLQYENKELLVPLHESLIEIIDEENKIIAMVLPDGLLDL